MFSEGEWQLQPEMVLWEARGSGGDVSICEDLGAFPQGSRLGKPPLGASLYTPHGLSRLSSVGRRRRRRLGPKALAAGDPAMADSVERLQQRVKELERELAQERNRRDLGDCNAGGGRARIEKMSPEVVDSNPYRWPASWIGGWWRGWGPGSHVVEWGTPLPSSSRGTHISFLVLGVLFPNR